MAHSNDYYAAFEPDLRSNPNYSFEIGDIDGHNCQEVVFPRQDGCVVVIKKRCAS